MLRLRLGEHKGDPKYKRFADKLDELRERMEQNLISSIDFLKQLLELARDLLKEEKEVDQPQDKRAQARAALTDLFQSIKTEDADNRGAGGERHRQRGGEHHPPVYGCIQERDGQTGNQEKAPLYTLGEISDKGQ